MNKPAALPTPAIQPAADSAISDTLLGGPVSVTTTPVSLAEPRPPSRMPITADRMTFHTSRTAAATGPSRRGTGPGKPLDMRGTCGGGPGLGGKGEGLTMGQSNVIPGQSAL